MPIRRKGNLIFFEKGEEDTFLEKKKCAWQTTKIPLCRNVDLGKSFSSRKSKSQGLETNYLQIFFLFLQRESKIFLCFSKMKISKYFPPNGIAIYLILLQSRSAISYDRNARAHYRCQNIRRKSYPRINLMRKLRPWADRSVKQ